MRGVIKHEMIFNPKVRGVIFDLGDTLMVPIGSWGNVFLKAGSSLQEYLCVNKILSPNTDFKSDFLERLNQYYILREKTYQETTTAELLRELLKNYHSQPIDETMLVKGLDTFYQVTRQNWRLDPAAIPTLKAIEDLGYKIGMISNAGNEDDVLKLIENFGLSSYFSFIITSASVGFRKPHPQIFQAISSFWDLAPSEILMVGDRIDTDVLGASTFGMRTVWLNRNRKTNPHIELSPDIETDELADILKFL